MALNNNIDDSQVRAAKAELDRLQQSAEPLSEQISAATNALSAATKALEVETKAVEAMQKDIEKFSADLTKFQESVTKETKAVETAAKALETENKALTEANNTLTKCQNDLKLRDQELKAAITKETAAQKTFDDATKAVTTAESAVNTAEGAVKDAESAVSTAQDSFDAASSELTNAESAYESASNAYDSFSIPEKKYKTRKKKNGDEEREWVNEGEIERAKSKRDQLRSKRDSAKTKVESAKTKKTKAATALTNAQAKLKTAQDKLKTAQLQLKDAQGKKADAQKALTEAKTVRAKAELAKASAETAVKNATLKVTEAKDKVTKAQTTLKTAQEGLKKVQEELKKKQEELKKLQEKLKTAQTKLNDAKAKVEKAKKDLEALKNQENKVKADIKKAEAALKKAEAELEKAKKAQEEAARIAKEKELELERERLRLQRMNVDAETANVSAETANVNAENAKLPPKPDTSYDDVEEIRLRAMQERRDPNSVGAPLRSTTPQESRDPNAAQFGEEPPPTTTATTTNPNAYDPEHPERVFDNLDENIPSDMELRHMGEEPLSDAEKARLREAELNRRIAQLPPDVQARAKETFETIEQLEAWEAQQREIARNAGPTNQQLNNYDASKPPAPPQLSDEEIEIRAMKGLPTTPANTPPQSPDIRTRVNNIQADNEAAYQELQAKLDELKKTYPDPEEYEAAYTQLMGERDPETGMPTGVVHGADGTPQLATATAVQVEVQTNNEALQYYGETTQQLTTFNNENNLHGNNPGERQQLAQTVYDQVNNTADIYEERRENADNQDFKALQENTTKLYGGVDENGQPTGTYVDPVTGETRMAETVQTQLVLDAATSNAVVNNLEYDADKLEDDVLNPDNPEAMGPPTRTQALMDDIAAENEAEIARAKAEAAKLLAAAQGEDINAYVDQAKVVYGDPANPNQMGVLPQVATTIQTNTMAANHYEYVETQQAGLYDAAGENLNDPANQSVIQDVNTQLNLSIEEFEELRNIVRQNDIAGYQQQFMMLAGDPTLGTGYYKDPITGELTLAVLPHTYMMGQAGMQMIQFNNYNAAYGGALDQYATLQLGQNEGQVGGNLQDVLNGNIKDSREQLAALGLQFNSMWDAAKDGNIDGYAAQTQAIYGVMDENGNIVQPGSFARTDRILQSNFITMDYLVTRDAIENNFYDTVNGTEPDALRRLGRGFQVIEQNVGSEPNGLFALFGWDRDNTHFAAGEDIQAQFNDIESDIADLRQAARSEDGYYTNASGEKIKFDSAASLFRDQQHGPVTIPGRFTTLMNNTGTRIGEVGQNIVNGGRNALMFAGGLAATGLAMVALPVLAGGGTALAGALGLTTTTATGATALTTAGTVVSTIFTGVTGAGFGAGAQALIGTGMHGAVNMADGGTFINKDTAQIFNENAQAGMWIIPSLMAGGALGNAITSKLTPFASKLINGTANIAGRAGVDDVVISNVVNRANPLVHKAIEGFGEMAGEQTLTFAQDFGTTYMMNIQNDVPPEKAFRAAMAAGSAAVLTDVISGAVIDPVSGAGARGLSHFKGPMTVSPTANMPTIQHGQVYDLNGARVNANGQRIQFPTTGPIAIHAPQLDIDVSNLNSGNIDSHIRELVASGQPDVALETYRQFKAANPDYKPTPDLKTDLRTAYEGVQTQYATQTGNPDTRVVFNPDAINPNSSLGLELRGANAVALATGAPAEQDEQEEQNTIQESQTQPQQTSNSQGSGLDGLPNLFGGAPAFAMGLNEGTPSTGDATPTGGADPAASRDLPPIDTRTIENPRYQSALTGAPDINTALSQFNPNQRNIDATTYDAMRHQMHYALSLISTGNYGEAISVLQNTALQEMGIRITEDFNQTLKINLDPSDFKGSLSNLYKALTSSSMHIPKGMEVTLNGQKVNSSVDLVAYPNLQFALPDGRTIRNIEDLYSVFPNNKTDIDHFLMQYSTAIAEEKIHMLQHLNQSMMGFKNSDADFIKQNLDKKMRELDIALVFDAYGIDIDANPFFNTAYNRADLKAQLEAFRASQGPTGTTGLPSDGSAPQGLNNAAPRPVGPRAYKNFNMDAATSQNIQTLLTGGDPANGLYAPTAVVDTTTPEGQQFQADLSAFLSGETDTLSPTVQETQAQMNRDMRNAYTAANEKINDGMFFHPDPTKYYGDLKADYQKFRAQLQDMVHQGRMPQESLKLMDNWVAAVAPTLNALGFPNSHQHSVQVMQTNFVKALNRGGTPEQAMMAAMLGFVHDPKLPGPVSFSNLGAHPLTATALIQHMATHPEVRQSVAEFLGQNQAMGLTPDSVPGGPTPSSLTVDEFMNALAESASINENKWVTNVVISGGMGLDGYFKNIMNKMADGLINRADPTKFYVGDQDHRRQFPELFKVMKKLVANQMATHPHNNSSRVADIVNQLGAQHPEWNLPTLTPETANTFYDNLWANEANYPKAEIMAALKAKGIVSEAPYTAESLTQKMMDDMKRRLQSRLESAQRGEHYSELPNWFVETAGKVPFNTGHLKTDLTRVMDTVNALRHDQPELGLPELTPDTVADFYQSFIAGNTQFPKNVLLEAFRGHGVYSNENVPLINMFNIPGNLTSSDAQFSALTLWMSDNGGLSLDKILNTAPTFLDVAKSYNNSLQDEIGRFPTDEVQDGRTFEADVKFSQIEGLLKMGAIVDPEHRVQVEAWIREFNAMRNQPGYQSQGVPPAALARINSLLTDPKTWGLYANIGSMFGKPITPQQVVAQVRANQANLEAALNTHPNGQQAVDALRNGLQEIEAMNQSMRPWEVEVSRLEVTKQEGFSIDETRLKELKKLIAAGQSEIQQRYNQFMAESGQRLRELGLSLPNNQTALGDLQSVLNRAYFDAIDGHPLLFEIKPPSGQPPQAEVMGLNLESTTPTTNLETNLFEGNNKPRRQVIGRILQSDILISDIKVSKEHAELLYDPITNHYLLKDLNSTNGTRVNGEYIRERVLQNGDIIRIGDTQLIFDNGELRKPLQKSFTIGRNPIHNIVIANGDASRNHAQLDYDELTPSEGKITDIGSSNGTYLNGRKLRPNEPTTLYNGDAVQIGTETFIFYNGSLIPKNQYNMPPQSPIPVASVKAAPLPPGLALSRGFNENHIIPGGTAIPDGYIDGGRGYKIDDQGKPISSPSREIIVVDRTKDATLRSIIAEAKAIAPNNLPEKERIQALFKFVDTLFSNKHLSMNGRVNFDGIVNDAKNLPKQEMLLGDIIDSESGVCRHRTLLFKILGDELGLNVDLVRGNYFSNGHGGGHAWNVVHFQDGTQAIVDVMHQRILSTDDPNVKNYYTVKNHSQNYYAPNPRGTMSLSPQQADLLLASQQNRAIDLNNLSQLEVYVPSEGLVRTPGNEGRELPLAYRQNSAEARQRFEQAMADGSYDSPEAYLEALKEAHKLAYGGSTGNNLFYKTKSGDLLQFTPGEVRGQGPLQSIWPDEAEAVDAIAEYYGDPYRSTNTTWEGVKLLNLPKDQLPILFDKYSIYPPGEALPVYFKAMQETGHEALAMIAQGADPKATLFKIAEHYQIAANARPFTHINNSLFMNEVNLMLRQMGLKEMPHGMMDHVAFRLQPDNFKQYFYDQVMAHQTGQPMVYGTPKIPANEIIHGLKGKSPAEVKSALLDIFQKAYNKPIPPDLQDLVKRALQTRADMTFDGLNGRYPEFDLDATVQFLETDMPNALAAYQSDFITKSQLSAFLNGFIPFKDLKFDFSKIPTQDQGPSEYDRFVESMRPFLENLTPEDFVQIHPEIQSYKLSDIAIVDEFNAPDAHGHHVEASLTSNYRGIVSPGEKPIQVVIDNDTPMADGLLAGLRNVPKEAKAVILSWGYKASKGAEEYLQFSGLNKYLGLSQEVTADNLHQLLPEIRAAIKKKAFSNGTDAASSIYRQFDARLTAIENLIAQGKTIFIAAGNESTAADGGKTNLNMLTLLDPSRVFVVGATDAQVLPTRLSDTGVGVPAAEADIDFLNLEPFNLEQLSREATQDGSPSSPFSTPFLSRAGYSNSNSLVSGWASGQSSLNHNTLGTSFANPRFAGGYLTSFDGLLNPPLTEGTQTPDYYNTVIQEVTPIIDAKTAEINGLVQQNQELLSQGIPMLRNLLVQLKTAQRSLEGAERQLQKLYQDAKMSDGDQRSRLNDEIERTKRLRDDAKNKIDGLKKHPFYELFSINRADFDLQSKMGEFIQANLDAAELIQLELDELTEYRAMMERTRDGMSVDPTRPQQSISSINPSDNSISLAPQMARRGKDFQLPKPNIFSGLSGKFNDASDHLNTLMNFIRSGDYVRANQHFFNHVVPFLERNGVTVNIGESPNGKTIGSYDGYTKTLTIAPGNEGSHIIALTWTEEFIHYLQGEFYGNKAIPVNEFLSMDNLQVTHDRVMYYVKELLWDKAKGTSSLLPKPFYNRLIDKYNTDPDFQDNIYQRALDIAKIRVSKEVNIRDVFYMYGINVQHIDPGFLDAYLERGSMNPLP